MKILIDQCSSKKNGELLRLMIGKFDVFMTIDNNLEYPPKAQD